MHACLYACMHCHQEKNVSTTQHTRGSDHRPWVFQIDNPERTSENCCGRHIYICCSRESNSSQSSVGDTSETIKFPDITYCIPAERQRTACRCPADTRATAENLDPSLLRGIEIFIGGYIVCSISWSLLPNYRVLRVCVSVCVYTIIPCMLDPLVITFRCIIARTPARVGHTEGRRSTQHTGGFSYSCSRRKT